jgi:succinylglutamate desuccinylase
MNTYRSLITKIGTGKPVVAVVGGMHGDESGTQIIELLKKKIILKKGSVVFILANPYAIKEHIRFINADLNRVFPGKENGNIEEQLANKLVLASKKYEYLLDLHSCGMESEPFCIIRKKSGKQLELAQKTALPNIVVYPQKQQQGKSFIDYVSCGIGLELGLHKKKETIKNGYNAVLSVLSKLDMLEESIGEEKVIIQNMFYVTKHLYKLKKFTTNSKIKNFQLVKKGTILGFSIEKARRAREDFYPVLLGEKAYTNILCWVAKKSDMLN